MTKRALITGITGQDGSYLAELLLEQGYEVVGMVRRSSTLNFERIAHIQGDIQIAPGDLLDEGSMIHVLRAFQPEELYNLAAQSFVQTSWSQAVLTGETTALGVTRALDAIRIVNPEIRFYQASSSEMFGKVHEVPQTETTPFYPRSPYGVAKVYGHWITVNYRESYGLHASSGMLFNHESVPAWAPVVVRRRGLVDVRPIGELVGIPEDAASARRISRAGGDFEVWDGERFVACSARTAYRYDGDVVVLRSAGGVVECTPDHVVITAGGDKPAREVAPGERLRLARPAAEAGPAPAPAGAATGPSEDEAWLLGLLVAGGHVGGHGHACLPDPPDWLAAEVAGRWERVTGGSVALVAQGGPGAGGDDAKRLELVGAEPYLRSAGAELGLDAGAERVPVRVLNAGPAARRAFLHGFAAARGGDGAGPAGEPVVLEAPTPLLAAGLVWLARGGDGAPEARVEESAARPHHYRVELHPAGAGSGRSGPPAPEVVERCDRRPFRGWMCDLATESGRYAAGVGAVVVHNSPRRGLEFVTRKITNGVARISHGLQQSLALGNLDSQRDWGYAGDYVRAMWLMLQQDRPDDFVVATGETHSVRDFCELAFSHAGLDWREHVVVDERLIRPAEVDLLVGDASKAREVLGWKPEVSFAELVQRMVDADLDLVERQKTFGIL